MNRLSQRDFWDARHEDHRKRSHSPGNLRNSFIKRKLDSIRTDIGAWPMDSYSEFLTRRVIIKHLPKNKEWCCLEIGCAPGNNIIDFNKLFGYEPSGVEYSPVGVQESRELIKQAGFNPQNIIESDLFDPLFQNKHASRFNVVFSRGFIEHFNDPLKVIKAHVNLVAPGGYLVCTIPNLLSWGYPYIALFARDILNVHNLTIMRRNTFRKLFVDLGMNEMYCNYSGMFGIFGLVLRREHSFRGILAKLLDRINDAVNHLFFPLLRGWAFESRWSPHLIYIGHRDK